MSTRETVKLLVDRASDFESTDKLLELAARNSENLDTFEIVWSRRRNDEITEDLVLAPAENRISCSEILTLLLNHAADRGMEVRLKEDVMKAIAGQGVIEIDQLETLFNTASSQGVKLWITEDVLRAVASSVADYYNESPMLLLLLKSTTDIVITDVVFAAAAGSGLEENLRILSSHCGMDEIPKRWSNVVLLYKAVFELGNIELVKDLLEQGVDPNVPDGNGMTPLSHIAISGREMVAKELLAGGVDPNFRVENGRTPLFWSALCDTKGSCAVVNMLLSAGADPNLEDNHGQTPLFLAAQYGHYALAQILLAKGVQTHLEDEKGNTPSSLAKSKGHIKIYRLLEKCRQ